MFGFLDMMNNYEDRKVDRYEKNDLMISTAAVTDGDFPFETAVRHPLYNENDYIIVESYSDLESAKKGHKKWIKKMTKDVLPEHLDDCSNALIGQLAKDAGCDTVFYKQEFNGTRDE